MDDENCDAVGYVRGNLLFTSGSRPVRRETEGVAQRVNLTHRPDARHSAQQAFFSSWLCWRTRSAALAKRSSAIRSGSSGFKVVARSRRLIGMIEWALEFTDLEALSVTSTCSILASGCRAPIGRRIRTARSRLKHVAEHPGHEQLYDKALQDLSGCSSAICWRCETGWPLVGLPKNLAGGAASIFA